MTSTETTPMDFRSTDTIERAMDRAGSHWWDRDTMRFFATLIPHTHVYGGRVFIASHRPPNGPRLYAVHIVERTVETRDDGRSVERYTIQNAEDILDSPVSLVKARAVAQWVAAQDMPEHFTYEESVAFAARVSAFRDGRERR